MLKLDWNEATVPPSPNVAKRVLELAQQGDFYNIYPSTTNEELTALLSKYCGLPAENMLYFSGSDAVHECISRVFLAPGDPVLLLGPTYDNFRLTAEALGNRVFRCYDAGVAGIHRLLAAMDELRDARVVIAVAGMEGALASVVGGLVDCPVIAVPTSVGYGANFGGLSALLSMLNSCASGVSVVNIDNGFGAGYLASMINHMAKED